MRKRIAATSLAVLAAVSMLLAGCGSVSTSAPGTNETQAEAADSSGTETVSSTAVKKVKDPYNEEIKLALIHDNIGHPVSSAWEEGMRRDLEAFPNITLQALDGKSSVETQVQQMTDLVNQGYDGIFLQANDAAALASSVKQAEDAGIPVITLNLDAETGMRFPCCFTAPLAGRKA